MTLENYKRVLTAQVLFLANVSLIANYLSLDSSKFPYTLGGIFGMMIGTIAHVWFYRVEPETKVVEKTIEVPVEKTADFETTIVYDYGDFVDQIVVKNMSRIEMSCVRNSPINVYSTHPAVCTRAHKQLVKPTNADHSQSADKNSDT